MSYADPVHWRGRAEEMRAAAEQMQDCVSKQMMQRIADDYERLAQTAEQRAKDCPPHPIFALAAIPKAARQFALRRTRLIPSPPSTPDPAIPHFLKRGPATAEEVGAPIGPGPKILMRNAPESTLAPAVDGDIAMAEPWVPLRPNPKSD
jgi:hypothetical protein